MNDNTSFRMFRSAFGSDDKTRTAFTELMLNNAAVPFKSPQNRFGNYPIAISYKLAAVYPIPVQILKAELSVLQS